jgi:hypothetical protein
MRRGFATLAALTVLAASAVPAALGDRPTRDPLPATDFTIPAEICGFEIQNEVLTNNEYILVFSDGRATVTGALRVRLTNLEDPSKSIVVNIPGPGMFDESGALTAVGPWFWFFLPGDLGEGSPGMAVLTYGRVRLDETGFHLLAGRQIDLCAALAST